VGRFGHWCAMRATTLRRALGTGLILCASAVAGCVPSPFSRLDQIESEMVAAAKVDRLIQPAFPSNCARMEVGTNWGTLDEPAWDGSHDRCSKFSRKLLIVLHRVSGRWRVAGSTRFFPSPSGCRIPGVPINVVRSILICYPLHSPIPFPVPRMP
jgi:hypothetical protein